MKKFLILQVDLSDSSATLVGWLESKNEDTAVDDFMMFYAAENQIRLDDVANNDQFKWSAQEIGDDHPISVLPPIA